MLYVNLLQYINIFIYNKLYYARFYIINLIIQGIFKSHLFYSKVMHISFKEPFDAEEFVERLAWRTIAETKTDSEDEDFNPTLLHESFVQAIK